MHIVMHILLHSAWDLAETRPLEEKCLERSTSDFIKVGRMYSLTLWEFVL